MSERCILCYGDSNTYGYDGASYRRFPPDVRWTGVLACALGDGWRIVEEGLGGRTTVHDDPFLPNCNGLTYLAPCLSSHAPLDLVVLALGMNDLKPRFGLPPSDVARGVGVLAELVQRSGAGPDGAAPQVLVLGTPRLGRLDAADEQYAGLARKVERLPSLLLQEAKGHHVAFLDLLDVAAFSDADGLHLDERGHEAVGAAVARAVRTLFDDAGR